MSPSIFLLSQAPHAPPYFFFPAQALWLFPSCHSPRMRTRRVIAARANPKLDWGQTRATELSFALDELTEATKAHDKAMGIESPVAEAG